MIYSITFMLLLASIPIQSLPANVPRWSMYPGTAVSTPYEMYIPKGEDVTAYALSHFKMKNKAWKAVGIMMAQPLP